jgi:hypothetical protein
MLRLYKFGGGIWGGSIRLREKKRILFEQDPLYSYLQLVTSLLY